jgi:hypothetical protein
VGEGPTCDVHALRIETDPRRDHLGGAAVVRQQAAAPDQAPIVGIASNRCGGTVPPHGDVDAGAIDAQLVRVWDVSVAADEARDPLAAEVELDNVCVAAVKRKLFPIT